MNSGQRAYRFCAVLLLAVLIAAEAGAEARGGWLGTEITDEPVYMGLRRSGGLGSQGPMVIGAIAGGPAQKAGIKAGDTILAVDGIQAPDIQSLRALVRSIEPGKTVPVTVVRKGKLLNLSVTIGNVQTEASVLRRAAEGGDAYAQYTLANAYREGEGVPQDDAEAVRWYRRAAAQGHAEAQDALRNRGLTWTVAPPEHEAPRAASPTPSSPPAAKERAPRPKIPDDLGDLD